MSSNTTVDYGSLVPWSFHGSSIPIYVSSSQISMASILERSYDDTLDMIQTSSTTLSTASTGANGLLVSPSLSGTVAVTNGSGTVTGTGSSFTTDFQVGDVICVSGAQNRVVASITSNTQLTTATNFTSTVSGASYTRGGGVAPNAMFYLYAISSSTGSNAALALSCRSQGTGDTFPSVDLPSGYTEYRQLPMAFPTDSSGNLIPFDIYSWPTAPCYTMGTSAATQLFNGSAPTTMTAINCQNFVPKIANNVLLYCISGSASANVYCISNGDPNVSNAGYMVLNQADEINGDIRVGLNPSTRQIQHQITTSANVTLYVRGFSVTEII